MMTAELQVLVLRRPEQQGNYRYWLAELPADEAERLEERLSHGGAVPRLSELGDPFGESLTLSEVMDKLQTRDFRVLNYPVGQ
jgi:hypothetical protein